MASDTVLGIERADLPLTCVGGLLAIGLSVGAGVLVMRSDGRPMVNGTEQMAVFAKPSRLHDERMRAQARPAAVATREDAAPSGIAVPPNPPIDFLPTASLPAWGTARPATAASPRGGYVLVAARGGSATFRGPSGALVARPGDDVPGVGRIEAIIPDGRGWKVILTDSASR